MRTAYVTLERAATEVERDPALGAVEICATPNAPITAGQMR